jgi:NAD-dependent dihydropyrimidine dehydrogenase PreA subunit
MTQAGKRIYKVEVDSALCKECDYCREICEQGVFASSGLFNKAGYVYMNAEHVENCSGCMKCATICPDFAITVEQQEETPQAAGDSSSVPASEA